MPRANLRFKGHPVPEPIILQFKENWQYLTIFGQCLHVLRQGDQHLFGQLGYSLAIPAPLTAQCLRRVNQPDSVSDIEDGRMARSGRR